MHACMRAQRHRVHYIAVSLMRATLNTDSMSRDDVYFCRVPFNEDEFKSARPLRIGW
jgi:hypothetical protein